MIDTATMRELLAEFTDAPLAARNAWIALADELDRLRAELDATQTWSGLMATLDTFYPPDVFTGESGDSGPRIVCLIREIDKLRAELDAANAGAAAMREAIEPLVRPEGVFVTIGIEDRNAIRAALASDAGKAVQEELAKLRVWHQTDIDVVKAKGAQRYAELQLGEMADRIAAAESGWKSCAEDAARLERENEELQAQVAAAVVMPTDAEIAETVENIISRFGFYGTYELLQELTSDLTRLIRDLLKGGRRCQNDVRASRKKIFSVRVRM